MISVYKKPSYVTIRKHRSLHGSYAYATIKIIAMPMAVHVIWCLPYAQNAYATATHMYTGNYPQRRIRNRWLVAYTLIRNPSIQCLTGSKLQLVSEEDSKSENLSDTVCGKNLPEVA